MAPLCLYPGCFNKAKLIKLRASTSEGDASLRFHRFPVNDPERLKLWLLAIRWDVNTPVDKVYRRMLCSEHFRPRDYKTDEGKLKRYLNSSAVPMPAPLFQLKEEKVSDSDALSADDCEDIKEEEEEKVYFADIQSTSGKQKNHRPCPVQRGQRQSKLVLKVTNQSTSPSPSPSICGSYYALPPTWHYQMDNPAEIGLQMGGRFDVNVGMDSAAAAAAASSQGVFMASEDSTGHPDMYTEDTAQSTEELVITKVEDCTVDMAVDQNEDYSGKMEVDGLVDSETKKNIDGKTQTMESSALTIKDEPMDEEWKKETQPPVRNIKDDEDFDQTPDDVKIRDAFSVGVNASNTSIGAPVSVPEKAPIVPAEPIQPFNQLGLLCTACNKVMVKGQTAFQRSGSSKLYCSPACLCSSKTKTCHCCLKEIRDQHNTVIGPVDVLGTLRDFCSQKCLSALNFKCSVCQKTGVTHSHEVNFMGSIHKMCSDSCLNQFCSSNKLNMSSCGNCGGYCSGTDSQCLSLRMEDRVMKFCKLNCLKAFKQRSLKLVTCKICHTLRPAADAVDSPNSEGIRELFCSASCATASKSQTSSSGVPVECYNCKLKLMPQYHLAMFDGSVQNFCSFSCVLANKESSSKTKPNNQVNMATSTSKNTSTPKPAAPKPAAPKPAPPKPASSASSSSTKPSTPSASAQTGTKIPCYQCLNSFFHRPELLEFKRKMYAFCNNACIEEFRRINNVVARCEHCKLNKTVKIVRRINKVDRSFCNEKCKSLFEHNLVKKWGKKHCRNCFYCDSSSKTVVTEFFDGKQEEFCGNDCLSKHSLLNRQEIKCSMCRQAKKTTETVKWLGEMKHFCTLRCLMFFCSLQGVTGAVVKATSKSIATQSATPVSPAVPQSTKEATPVIASVVSLSNASNKQPNPKGSVPAAVTVKVTEHKRAVKAPVSSSQILKNKVLQYKSTSKNKATSCKPHTTDAETQIDEMPKVIVLPVPVPVFVPVPMHLYSQYVPQAVGLPLPVPVPLFFPTTLDSAEHIVKTIQEIKEKIPDDPLEAELLMMAEMVAEDTETEKHITSSDQTGNIMEDLDFEALSNNLSWEEDSVSSPQTWDQPSEPERPPLSISATLTPVSTVAEEPQMDLEADFPVESIELLREQTQKDTDSGKRRTRKRGNDGFPQKKKGHKCANILSKLQHEYGVTAWKDWLRWRNAQPNMETPKFGSRAMAIKEDLLKCCTAELSYGLSKFISEVRRPTGEKYSPDSIFYLCLGIQQYLFENNRMENIFSDVFYSKFCHEMTNLLKGWKPTIFPSGYVHSRVEEEYLWDCKQLGAFSPGVLLNTLLYFFTKFFNYKTVEQHRSLSFANVKRYSRGPANSKVSYLRFYPPKEDASVDGVPVKKRKKEDERQRVLKIRQNADNPLRCPVKLYEFYLSKCSPGIRNHATQFYLSPERSCVPSSPTWFTTTSLSDEALDSMLTRILTVRELHMEMDRTNESDSDSDSDFRLL